MTERYFPFRLHIPVSGFVWNVDMLKEYGLDVPGKSGGILNVCETLKENGILSIWGEQGILLYTLPVMCAGLL